MSASTYDSEKIGTEEYKDSMAGIAVLDSFRFYSEGKNGRFELRTFITRAENFPQPDLFNLGFGMWDRTCQTCDDRIRTRNEDMPKILGTVANIALNFLKKYPHARLYAEGSTFARTRLYQREISKVVDDLPTELQIHGLIRKENIGFVAFRKGINFDGFLLSASNL